MNPFYAGLIRDGEGFIEGGHEAIIDRQTWEQMEALRGARARTHKRGRDPLGRQLIQEGLPEVREMRNGDGASDNP